MPQLALRGIDVQMVVLTRGQFPRFVDPLRDAGVEHLAAVLLRQHLRAPGVYQQDRLPLAEEPHRGGGVRRRQQPAQREKDGERFKVRMDRPDLLERGIGEVQVVETAVRGAQVRSVRAEDR